ncbi:beta-ketoacyl synthase N-terminal-like domain-containing protein [Stappia indica]|uniref:beta-ketoacyl synthase N-terminal-like domain-containing protein n=1 Tax=Stappia indica TaxID=538381 RepID=UPI001CD3BB63|nr:beta-ketoacyl synthase N-terminal-like domain-containing protein [Stappia indica]MCA1299037.1 hypothetical protein [Stappia indica]
MTGIVIRATAAGKAANDGSMPADMLCAERRSPRVGAINTQARMVVQALRRCLEGNGRPQQERIGLSLGTAHGANGIVETSLKTAHGTGFEDVVTAWYATGLPNSTAGVVASLEQLLGPNLTLLGEQSGLEAIVMACRLIRARHVDGMVAGGFDTPASDSVPGEGEAAPSAPVKTALPGVGLLMLAAAEDTDSNAVRILGWSSDMVGGRSDDDLIAAALAVAGRTADPSNVRRTVLGGDRGDGDYRAATGPIHLIEVIGAAPASGLHAFISHGNDGKAVCLLLDIPSSANGEIGEEQRDH